MTVKNKTYIGDRKLCALNKIGENITCQIHNVKVVDQKGKSLGTHYYVAIHIPKVYGTHYQVIR